MKRKMYVFEQRISRCMLGDTIPATVTVRGVYLTDKLHTYCCDLSPSWYHEALEYRVDPVEGATLEDEERENLEVALNECAYEDRGYMYVRDCEQIPVLAEQEIEIDDEDLAGCDAGRIQAAFLEKAREDWNAQPWA